MIVDLGGVVRAVKAAASPPHSTWTSNAVAGGGMRFEERELKEYAEPISPDELKEGEVYFSVIFLDKDGMVPIMEPKVFIGPKPEQAGDKLYFQDYTSYQRGIRFESNNAEEEATFTTGAGRYIFDYERALDVLMACALRQKKAPK